MRFSDLRIGDWFRIIEPDPDDSQLFVKLGRRTFRRLTVDEPGFRLAQGHDVSVEKCDGNAAASGEGLK
jgi:hypothetical protein